MPSNGRATDSSDDGPGDAHNGGGTKAKHVRLSRFCARGHGEYRVPVTHGVGGADRQGQAVVSNRGELVRLFLGQRGVGGHHADGGIAAERRRSSRAVSREQRLHGIVHAAALVPGACHEVAGIGVVDTSDRVDGNDGADRDAVPNIDASRPDATLDGTIQALRLRDGRSRPGADASLRNDTVPSVEARRVSVFSLGMDTVFRNADVEEYGRGHDRHCYGACPVPDISLGQVPHYSRRRIESECAPAAQDDGMDFRDVVGGTQQVGLAGPRC